MPSPEYESTRSILPSNRLDHGVECSFDNAENLKIAKGFGPAWADCAGWRGPILFANALARIFTALCYTTTTTSSTTTTTNDDEDNNDDNNNNNMNNMNDMNTNNNKQYHDHHDEDNNDDNDDNNNMNNNNMNNNMNTNDNKQYHDHHHNILSMETLLLLGAYSHLLTTK